MCGQLSPFQSLQTMPYIISAPRLRGSLSESFSLPDSAEEQQLASESSVGMFITLVAQHSNSRLSLIICG